MRDERDGQSAPHVEVLDDPIAYFVTSLKGGQDWATSLLKAMAVWQLAEENHAGRRYKYLIGGEAFDWLLLAERLCDAAGALVPVEEKEALLFQGRLPKRIDDALFRELLGVHKYRGYLNFFYGVVVEEALQLAVEREVHKRHLSNGIQYQEELSEEAFLRIYHEPKGLLLAQFRAEMGYASRNSISLTECKEFTYWLFKLRVNSSDKAKVASDTKKGLDQLKEMMDGAWLAVAVA